MQQLTLQFEGYADGARILDEKAPARGVQVINRIQQRLRRACPTHGTMLKHVSLRAVPRMAQAIRTRALAHSEALQDGLQCAALMGAGVFILWLAAVLQGGAA
ncbi:MAG: hypothetical protein IJK45_01345 [Bacteroidaceae bacterium]|nr:hypothetical protein [Bacteroidaceae bacterium]